MAVQAEHSSGPSKPTLVRGFDRAPLPSVQSPRLICASHREPFVSVKVGKARQFQRTTGGLVTALDAGLREIGGRWIATGDQTGTIEADLDRSGRSYHVDQIGLTSRELDHYYTGFSNGVLWPLFHYFVGKVSFQPDDWHDYHQVNRYFADAVAKGVESDTSRPTVVWIHDYQLMLAPRMVKDRLPKTPVGFFLHIPFPAFEVFRILPTRREILDGLLGADLVGFHTASYQSAFLDCARQLLGARIDRMGGIDYRGHHTRTIVSPIGIDVAQQVAMASDPQTASKAQRLRRQTQGEAMVLGVDRLDYSKGILERFAGFELLLDRHPEHRGHTTFVQIAVPSRVRVDDYKQLKRQTDEAVGRINGKYGDPSWEPVKYITRSFQAEELAAYYRAADVMLVTPLRDGMNLVAKEYVASRIDMGGALVLSEFAGAVEELPQAYIVNPFGPDSVAEGLHSALTDDRVERERRMTALSARVRASDIHHWVQSFVQQLARTT